MDESTTMEAMDTMGRNFTNMTTMMPATDDTFYLQMRLTIYVVIAR